MNDHSDDIQITTVELAIHRKSRSPVFGEGVIYVRLDDEAAGPFVTMKQMGEGTNESGYNEIKMDFEELEFLVEAIRRLKQTADQLEK